jgi:ribosomal protein S18 acetylase RimI-like enzyme
MSFSIQVGSSPALRAMTAADAPAVGNMIYRAIGRVFRDHGQPEPIADAAEGEALARLYLALDPEGSLVAERDGQLVGAGFIHVRDEVASLGPVVVDPDYQAQGIGKHLVDRLSERTARCASTRLFVDAFNTRAIGIVLKRGYVPRDHGLRLVALGGLRGPGMLHAMAPGPFRTLAAGDLDALAEFDSVFFGGSRRRDFAALMSAGATGLAMEEGGRWRGFLFGRVDGSLCILGPGSADSPELMAQLLARLGEELAPQATITLTCLLASQVDLVREAFAMGFRATSLALVMVRGNYTPSKRPAVIGLPPDLI